MHALSSHSATRLLARRPLPLRGRRRPTLCAPLQTTASPSTASDALYTPDARPDARAVASRPLGATRPRPLLGRGHSVLSAVVALTGMVALTAVPLSAPVVRLAALVTLTALITSQLPRWRAARG